MAAAGANGTSWQTRTLAVWITKATTMAKDLLLINYLAI